MLRLTIKEHIKRVEDIKSYLATHPEVPVSDKNVDPSTEVALSTQELEMVESMDAMSVSAVRSQSTEARFTCNLEQLLACSADQTTYYKRQQNTILAHTGRRIILNQPLSHPHFSAACKRERRQ